MSEPTHVCWQPCYNSTLITINGRQMMERVRDFRWLNKVFDKKFLSKQLLLLHHIGLPQFQSSSWFRFYLSFIAWLPQFQANFRDQPNRARIAELLPGCINYTHQGHCCLPSYILDAQLYTSCNAANDIKFDEKFSSGRRSPNGCAYR